MELVTLPDSRLFQTSVEIPNLNDEVRETAWAMVDTMHRANGVGLAGVQVGYLYRIFVVHIENDQPRIFINPKITAISDSLIKYEEGCLSIPGIYSDVERPDALTLEALSVEGEPFKLDAEDFLARVIQHEYDHLEGKLFYQHLSERKQDRFLRSYERLHTLTL